MAEFRERGYCRQVVHRIAAVPGGNRIAMRLQDLLEKLRRRPSGVHEHTV
jgi:hypothetical protein